MFVQWFLKPIRMSTNKHASAFTFCVLISFNTLRPRQDGRHFADDIFKCIFLNENVWIPIKISLKFVPNGPINNIPAMVQIMAWRRPGDKPLSEPMVVSIATHICVVRPQWVNTSTVQNAFLTIKYLVYINFHFTYWFSRNVVMMIKCNKSPNTRYGLSY